MVALTSTSFVFQGITIDTDGPYHLTAVDGWFGPTDGSAPDLPVAGGHGSLVTTMTRRHRVVDISGVCADKAARDTLFWAFRRAVAAGFDDGPATRELVGTGAGLTLTADAQLQRFAPAVVRSRWGRGVWDWAAQWRCPDPLLYGAPVTVLSMLGQPGTGLALPASLPAAFPANPVGGSFSTVNDGTGVAPAVYTLRGPITMPGVLLNAGTGTQRMVQYSLALGADDFLSIDTKEGGFLNGEYRPSLGGSDIVGDFGLLPGSNTVQALGTPAAGSPYISVTFRPAYW